MNICKKLYRCCTGVCWAVFVWFVLNTFTPSTVTTVFSKQFQNVQISKSVVSLTIEDNKNFFHVDYRLTDPEKETIVSLLNDNIHIYSAIAYNTTKRSRFDSIYLNGWENNMFTRFYKPNYTCCLIYDTSENNIFASRILEKHDWSYIGRSHLDVKQYVCSNILRQAKSLPVAVSLGMDRQCPRNVSKYIRIDYPLKQAGTQIGVCAKLVYENISAASLIEWFEYQRYMGVSKIISYTYRLNSAAMAVLEYYKSIGLGEHYPFNSLPKIGDRERMVGVKNFQGWNDEQVPVYDCQGKLSGYTYIGLYDTDEFLYPTDGSNFIQLLQTLRKQHINAAGFTLKTEVYATTWGVDNMIVSNTSLTIGRYTMRTEAFRDRVKSIVITERLQPGRLSTHGFWSKPPYKKPVVSESVATLKHYRSCRKEWMRDNGDMCYNTSHRIRDTTMIRYATNIEPEVIKVKNILGVE